jgi:hypothetical protein
MLLLFDAYSDLNANTSPTPWGGKYLSTDKEVRCLETSQKVICFKKLKKNMIHFCMKQHPDFLRNVLVIKPKIRSVGLIRKLMEYGL